jgi:hypothetical protein
MRRMTLIILLVVAVLSAALTVFAGTPGESGFLSLRMAVGARETAMGGTGVASSEGASAVYWNPALLAFEEPGTDLLLQHQRSFGLFDRESATLAHRTRFGVIGFFFSGFYSDDIERYSEENVGVAEGLFNPYQVAVGGTLSRQLNERLAIGVGAKLLHEDIDIYGGSGLAFDLFLAHKALIDGLWFGASYTNFGPDMKINIEDYPLPTALRFGMAWDPQWKVLARKLTMTADMISPNDGNQKAHVGVEYRLVPALSLRMGTKVNYESQGMTYGAGFRRNDLEVGYAYEDMVNDLEPAHRFSLRILFGREG